MTHRYPTTVSEGAARVLHDGRALLERIGRPLPPPAPSRSARAATSRKELRDSGGRPLTLRGLLRDYGQQNDPGPIPAAQRYLEVHDPKFRELKAGSVARFDAARDLLRIVKAAEPASATLDPVAALAPLGPKELPTTGADSLPTLPELQKLYPKEANDLGRVMAWLDENDEAYAALPPDGFDGKLHVAGRILDQLRRETANAVGASAVTEVVRRARERGATTLAARKGGAAPAPKLGDGPVRLADLPGGSQFEKAQLYLSKVDPNGFGRLPVAKQVAIFKAELARRGIAF